MPSPSLFRRATPRPDLPAVRLAPGSEASIEGLGMPFGGPFGGRDLHGQFFSAKTNFALDWFGERPLLYHHGLDADAGLSVVGRVISAKTTDLGVWVQAQLEQSSEYFDAIRQLIAAGKLFFSSGSMAHLVAADHKSGEITRWPWVELSLTPTPANLLATVDVATAEKRFAAAGIKADLAALKDLPAMPTPVDGEGGDPPHGSYEDLICVLCDLVCTAFGGGAWILATFPDYCVAVVLEAGETDPDYYEIAYTVDPATGEPALGEMREVQRVYVPAPAPLDDAPLAIQAARLTDLTGTLLERTQGLQQRRAREQRPLSAANRAALERSATALDGHLAALRALLAAPTPALAEATPSLGQRLDLLRLYAATLPAA